MKSIEKKVDWNITQQTKLPGVSFGCYLAIIKI